MFKLKTLSLTLALLSLPLTTFALTKPQSDTVPSNILEANFLLVQSQEVPGMIEADVNFAEAIVFNGIEHDIDLAQSSDDIVTISVGKNSIVYDPNALSNLLPLVPNATYNITFTRFNGEVYNSSVKMANAIVFTQPAPGSVFKKTDGVTVVWQPFKPDGLIASTQIGTETFCWGGLHFGSDDHSMVFEPGFAAHCPGPVPISFRLDGFMNGKGYGNVGAIITNTLQFSYDDATKTPMPKLSTHAIAEKFIATHWRKNNKVSTRSKEEYHN